MELLLFSYFIVRYRIVDGALGKSERVNKRACHCWCGYRIRGEYGAERMCNKFPYVNTSNGAEQSSLPWTTANTNRTVFDELLEHKKIL